jgi:photosystem II stability/assembly factor-like uncharacterized protein
VETEQWLYDVWASSPEDVFVVGSQGLILHFDGQGWTQQRLPSSGESLRAVHGSGPDDIWAVGDQGALVHFDGASWIEQGSGTDQNLSSVWVGSPSLAYASSQTSIFRYNGTSWQRFRLQ